MAIKKPIVIYNGNLSELQSGDTLAGSSGVSISIGSAILDFGNTPGTNIATVSVSDPNAYTTSNIFVDFFYNATATHNFYEHFFIKRYCTIRAVCETDGIVTVDAFSDLRLTGTFNVKYTIFN
jgi:hypothetical protein